VFIVCIRNTARSKSIPLLCTHVDLYKFSTVHPPRFFFPWLYNNFMPFVILLRRRQLDNTTFFAFSKRVVLKRENSWHMTLRWHFKRKCRHQSLFLKTSRETLDLKMNVTWHLSNTHLQCRRLSPSSPGSLQPPTGCCGTPALQEQPLVLCQVSLVHLVSISLVGFPSGRILVLDFRRTGGAAAGDSWHSLRNIHPRYRGWSGSNKKSPPMGLRADLFACDITRLIRCFWLYFRNQIAQK
jgi:hypothetical protein